jgi:hypothetical protein
MRRPYGTAVAVVDMVRLDAAGTAEQLEAAWIHAVATAAVHVDLYLDSLG